MAYVIVNGTNSSNFMVFVGSVAYYDVTLINPYTGYTISISELKNVNNAIYDGRGGTDTLSLTSDGDVLTLVDAQGTIMIKDIEIINAGHGGDIIILADAFAAYGNVIIRGSEGDDILWSNAGNDQLEGGAGNDIMDGGAGDDVLYGDAGDDYLSGWLGVDTLFGGEGNDTLVYNADAIWGAGSKLSQLGSSLPFADTVLLEGKNRSYDTFHGDMNINQTVTATGFDTLILTSGNDVLVTSDTLSPANYIFTPRVAYIDLIEAGDGDDVVDLSGADNFVDVIINGGDGDDVLGGSWHNDTLNGDAGNDRLFGSLGNDTLAGGTGDDSYYYNLGDGSDIIIETEGNDTIVFGAGIALESLALSKDNDDLIIAVGGETITIRNHFTADLSGRVETILFNDASTFDLSSWTPNVAPVALDDVFTGFHNAELSGNVLSNDTDENGDVLSVTAQSLTTANGGSFVLNEDGSFIYTPAHNFIGGEVIEYLVSDGKGGFDTATLTLTIDPDPATSIIDADGTDADDTIFALSDGATVKGMDGDDHIYGGIGDNILYGDRGVTTTITKDKVFSDGVIFPGLIERVNIANLNPSGEPALGIADGDLHVDFAATASITFRAGVAGYENSFGSYGITADGTIVSTSMEWANVKTAGVDITHQIDLPVGSEGGNFGFFIVSNGNNVNKGYSGLDVTGDGNLSFIYNYGKADQRAAKITDDGAKISLVYSDGVTTKVLTGNIFFTTDRGGDVNLNKDGKVHIVSGIMDTNDVAMKFVASDIVGTPTTITKNNITLTATSGHLIANGNNLGVKTEDKNRFISGTEAIRVDFAGLAEKVTFSLSGLKGQGKAIDFKIYLDGDTANPVDYEYVINVPTPGGKLDINLDVLDFGGLISRIEISSQANSSAGTENFYITGITAAIQGGADTNTLRIGFEDLYNTGDADYEDVLFDLDVNSVQVVDTSGGNDYLDGGAGNDILYGEGGNDILVIGLGADQAYGGFGADTFKITLVDDSLDTIHDFSLVEGDVIDISSVLENFDALAADIANFVQLMQNGTDAILKINHDGAGDDFVAAATIIGGGDLDLSTLLANNALIAA